MGYKHCAIPEDTTTMPCIAAVTASTIEVPLRHAFVTARDALARQVSTPVVVRLRLEDGRCFEGEAVPVAYVTGETTATVLAAVERAAPHLHGIDVARRGCATDCLDAHLPSEPAARAAIEMAIWNAWSAETGASRWALFGGAAASLETDVTISIVDDYLDRARDARERGFRRLKIKVGSPDPGDDLRRLRTIARHIPDAILRIDANQAFPDAAAAIEFIDRALEIGPVIEVYEQPVPKADLHALDAVAARHPDIVFADEAVLSPADAVRVLRETCVRGINVKLMKSGVQGALDIAAIGRAAGCRLMLGCMLETRRSIQFAVDLACGTGAFDYADLDSHLLLAEERPGAGPAPDGPVLFAGRAAATPLAAP